MRAIYKRELASYFHSMIGYVLIAFWIIFTGIYFMVYNLNVGYPYFCYALSGVLFIFIIATPILTMRSFAEERKSKTDQLLLTAPVRLLYVVLGKYAAMVTIFLIPNLVFCFFPLIIKTMGESHLFTDYMAIITFFLLGCVFIAVGMFLSSLTESQIIAAISTFGILAVIYMWSGLMNYLPTSAGANLFGVILILTAIVLIVHMYTQNWMISGILEAVGAIAAIVVYFVKSTVFESLLSNFLGKFDVVGTFSNIINNRVLNVSGWILYLSLIGLFIFLTMQTIQKRRWS